MKWHIIHLACSRISCTNFFSSKVFLDFFATDVFQPILSLLDECTCKHSFLAQLNDSLQDAEPQVQNHHETQVEDWGKHTQQQTNCGAHFISFLFTQLIRSVFAFHEINAPHDSTQTTTNRVVFITKWPRFARDKHETWTCELVGPYTHGLIQTVHISR